MAIFEFECSQGHVTERMVSLSERPATIPCEHPECKEEAKFVVSATPTTFRANDRKAFKRGGH